MQTDTHLLSSFETLALDAGKLVMTIFIEGCAIDRKSDDSPVTIADREAEMLILSGLRAICPHIPVVAEEAVAAGDFPADPGDEFLLVDPLDGTREFIERRAEFTVNIALVRGGAPVLGVVYAPGSGALYSGMPGKAERIETDGHHVPVSRRAIRARPSGPVPVVVASRSHRSEETDRYLAALRQAEIVSIGSSLKFCMLAAGEADLYPRFSRTMQWDTAAGDAVLRGAGGMTATLDGLPLIYGPSDAAGSECYANPWFVARGAENAAIAIPTAG